MRTHAGVEGIRAGVEVTDARVRLFHATRGAARRGQGAGRLSIPARFLQGQAASIK